MSGALQAFEARFELYERIGGGAFGEVWHGHDKLERRDVAIKRLHAHLADAPALLRFAREAALLARVESEFIVEYVAHGRDAEGRPWLAIEWLGGEDVARWGEREGATLRDALAVVRDAALGAAALHDAGIVHRDLKPANIIVAPAASGSGYATRIVDLGIAHLTDATVLTQAGTILGSPAYMAPEQVRGEAIDARADLWALGIVLFELLTGEPPFGSANAIAVLGKVLLEPVPALASLRLGLPPALEALIHQLLEKSPKHRLGDARVLAATLDEILTSGALDPAAALGHAPAGSVPGRGARTTQPQLAGERRLVALIFVRGGADSGELSVQAAIERYGGRAEPLRGAWLGGFGLARARGDELSAAVCAARDAQRGGARVGLVTGWAEVRVGSVVAGQLIERGAALLDAAAPGEVRVLGDAVHQLEAEWQFEPVADGEYRLVRERRRESMRPAGAPPLLLGRAVPALGRAKEVRLLEGVFLEAVEERSARVALVIGEAGLGKSRLSYELIHQLRAAKTPTHVLVLRGEPMLADVPTAMVVKGLRGAAGLEEGEGPEGARARLRAFASQWLDRDGGDLELLGELLRVPLPGDASKALRSARQDPALMRQLLREALARLLRAMCASAPLLLVLEDLHWADRASVDLFAWLFAELREEPAVLLAFSRPEVFDRHPSLWRGVAHTELRLAPLSQRASEQLIASVLEVGDDERRDIALRAGGNPLFLEELVRARAEGVRELPIAVHAALQVRLDALGSDARRLARAASVFGQTFWAEGLGALNTVQEAATGLRELVRAEVVVARAGSRFANTAEYAFSHALVRDAAYAMLVDKERRELHARAAAWLERNGESDPAVLGHHCEAGGRAVDAAAHYARAAHKALGESAYEGAEAYASRALACESAGRARAVTLLLRSEARRALGRTREMLEDARAADALAGDDAALQIEARSRVAQALRELGELAEADATLRKVLDESHASLLGARVQALLELAIVDLEAGRGGEAGTLIDEALSFLGEAGAGFEYQRLLALRARVSAHAASGELGKALDAAHVALEACGTAGHRARAAEARAMLGRMLTLVGRAAAAKPELEAALSEARALRLPYLEGQSLHFLGDAYASLGDLSRAIAAQNAAVTIGTEIGARRLTLAARAYKLLHLLERGGPGDVDEAAAAAASLATEAQPYAPLRCAADAIIAGAHLARGDAASAVRASERAFDELKALGTMEGLEEFVRLTHVRALAAAGRGEEAGAAIYQARERLARKGAKLRDGALRKSFAQGVPVNRALLELSRAMLGSVG